MATTAHSIYCIESLAASLEKRAGLSLPEVEELWAKYERALEQVDAADQLDGKLLDGDEKMLQSPAVSRLQAQSPASASSTPSQNSASSSSSAFSNPSVSSSKTSLFSFGRSTPKEEQHPVYITWNTLNARGHKALRGCIGTFEAQPLSEGLHEYALISAFQDHRFNQISLRELPSLSNTVTLLQNFTPCADAMDWQLGKHGLRIHFHYKGRRYGATYLPDVAPEQGWTKEETVVSLMRKAGWTGKEKDWKTIDLSCVRYEGLRADADYVDYKQWRDWLKGEGLA